MKFNHRIGLVAVALLALVTFSAVGCRPEQAKNTESTEHGEWWCQGHGVPESKCSLCQADARKKCQAEGDWCKEHKRAQSQCFKCDPSLYEGFEKEYHAKYGKKPERPPEKEFKK